MGLTTTMFSESIVILYSQRKGNSIQAKNSCNNTATINVADNIIHPIMSPTKTINNIPSRTITALTTIQERQNEYVFRLFIVFL